MGEFERDHRLTTAATAFLCATAMWGAMKAPVAAAEGPPAVPAVNAECGDPGYRAPKQVQVAGLICRMNNSRTLPLVETPALDAAAQEKLGDEIRCRHYSHLPCEEDTDPFEHIKANVDLVPEWHVGEDLAYGEGMLGKIRSIFGAWRWSPSHWENIQDENFTEVGIAIRHVRRIVMDVDLENGLNLQGVLLRNVDLVAAEFAGSGE